MNNLINENGIESMDVRLGDTVVASDGSIGKIVKFCGCEECLSRGFKEVCFQWNSGGECWITSYDKNAGFKLYYQIGEYRWPEHVDQEALANRILSAEGEITSANNKKKNAIRLLAIINGLIDIGEED